MDQTDIRVLPLIFLGLGSLFLGVAAVTARRRTLFLRRAEKTEGIVTGFFQMYGKGNKIQHPILEFTTGNGRKFTFRSPVGANPSPYRIGDKVSLLYDPANPENASAGSVFLVWLIPFIFAAIGVPFLIAGILVWRFA